MTVALDAKNTTMDDLLEHAASGDYVHLLQDGRRVATMYPAGTASFPPRTPEQIERARAGLARADERSKRLGLKFDFAEFKAEVEDGRL